MSIGPQYTSCVEAGDFEPLSTAYLIALGAIIGVGGLSAIATGGWSLWASAAALVELLHYVLDFMLNGKLICLHRDPSKGCACDNSGLVWAIGQVADSEDVGQDKNPVEDVDNDYAVNIILAPFDMTQFASDDGAQKNLATATQSTQPQGDLLKMQKDMPQDGGKPVFTAYFRTIVRTPLTRQWRAWTEIVGRDYGWFGIVGPAQQKAWGDYLLANAWLRPEKVSVPVLHCEFEGTRIRDMLGVINAFTFGGSWCKKNFLFKVLCKILQSILSPVILAAVAAAWAAAKDGDPADALQGGGTINNKDWLVVGGRWTYDGGHTGWNEFHATRIVHKVDYVPNDPTQFAQFQKRWCDELCKVPHAGVAGASLTGQPFTPEQQQTYDNQQEPQNQWVFHPIVDGCAGDEHPGPIR